MGDLAGAPEGDRVLGLPLELVLEEDPCTLHAGDVLTTHLLYQGEPCPGVRVVLQGVPPDAAATDRAGPVLATRTDAEGRVRFALPPGTLWLIRAVHMVHAPRGIPAEWESLWASLVFSSGTEGAWLPEGRQVTSNE